jgi:hypothetical protein
MGRVIYLDMTPDLAMEMMMYSGPSKEGYVNFRDLVFQSDRLQAAKECRFCNE